MMKEKTVSLDYLIGGNKNVLVLFSLFAILLITIPLISSVSLLNCNIPNTNPLCLTGTTEKETIAYGGIYFYDVNGVSFTANTSWLTTPAPGVNIKCGYARNILCNSTTGILTVLTDSIYSTEHTASITMGNNQVFESAIAVNNIIQENTISSVYTSAGERGLTTGFGRIQVFQGDNISFVFRSPDGTRSGTAYQLNFMVERLGG